MRSDRKNRRFSWWRWLAWLGKPLFWACYIVAYGIISFPHTLLVGYSRLKTFVIVVAKVWQNIFGARFRKTTFAPRPHFTVRRQWSWKYSFIFGVMLVFGLTFWWFILKDLPSPHTLVQRDQQVTTKIYDRNGEVLYKIYKNQNRSIISLADLPQVIIQATLAIEDDQFYQHAGFSIKGILRALTRNATTDSVQGGSTITQQLVKNTLLSREKTITRKLKEFVLSLEVEYYFTKDEILTMYFNEVGYGGTAYGIEEAAQQYFGKSARELSLAEATLLAGLPQSPTVYSPFGTQPELAIARQHAVLKRMVELKMITPEAAEAAKTQPLVFAQPKTDITAPHFVMYVKDILAQKYGETVVHSGGLEVHTTLDSRVQTLAETAVKQELDRLKTMHVTNAAALVIKPATGEILAMVGSQNYFDTDHDGQVNVTVRPRQPGSSIKSLTYALALQERLITPTTLIDDAPVVYRTPGSPPYAPQNYDGRFHGKVTVRQALANSYNVPAVKTLSQVGITHLVDFAQDMGITTWSDPSRFGLSLTLGGGEVKMVDLAEAYGVFANGGIRVPLTSLTLVSDYARSFSDQFDCAVDAVTHVCAGNQVVE